MRVGYIDYLNCFPFYYLLLEKEKPKDISIAANYPSELNAMIEKGIIDLSPISSAAFARVQNDVFLLREFCLSSIGYVRSVVLASNVPIEDLDGKKVGLSSASETSIVLLKVLLHKYYRVFPTYVPSSPLPNFSDLDAALVIGNEALSKNIMHVRFLYDIGELWRIKTGHPVVFAVFAVRENVLKKGKHLVDGIVDLFRKSLQCLESDRSSVISSAAKRYPEFDIAYIDEYYRLLRFTFTDELRDALQFYFAVAHDEGVIEKVNSIRWYY